MITEAKLKSNQKSINFLCEDINSYEIEKESINLIIAYYSIQFIHPSQRQFLINKIYKSLKWGGAFIMFEKVRGSDARFQDILSSCYLDFKLKKGYSPENIIKKQQSLKSVLEPFSRQGNIDILKRSGFIDIETIQKYICFEGFIGYKVDSKLLKELKGKFVDTYQKRWRNALKSGDEDIICFGHPDTQVKFFYKNIVNLSIAKLKTILKNKDLKKLTLLELGCEEVQQVFFSKKLNIKSYWSRLQ